MAIEQLENSEWVRVRLSSAVYNDNVAVVGGRFRILIDGKVLYDSKMGKIGRMGRIG